MFTSLDVRQDEDARGIEAVSQRLKRQPGFVKEWLFTNIVFSYRNRPLPDPDVEAAGDASSVDAPERIESTFAPTFLTPVENSELSCLFEDSAMMYCYKKMHKK